MLSNLSKMLDFYSQFNPSPLSIKQFMDFGKKKHPNFPPFLNENFLDEIAE